ncbi:MAG: LysE family transporter [Actinomycetota bacterium]|nr:LysE family transporter [Actinomycetota bacterium]
MGRAEPDPVPGGLDDAHSRSEIGQHPRAHPCISQGHGAALVSAAGASLGLVGHSAFAAVGLSALLAQSALAFSLVKYAGAAYLIYQGVRTLPSKEGLAVSGQAAPAMLRSVFFQVWRRTCSIPRWRPSFWHFCRRSSRTRTRAARPCNCLLSG